MQRILWLITVMGAILAFLQLGLTMMEDSAPKQAAGAGMALCFAVIPYILSRAMAKLNAENERVLAERAAAEY